MPKKSEGGWSGIGMANSGIDPTHVYFLNDHPTQIPPSEILGPVIQNCRGEKEGEDKVGVGRLAKSRCGHMLLKPSDHCDHENGNDN